MGCCNSKNDDVNKTDIQTITNNKNPVSNKSDLSTQNTKNSSSNSGSNETNNITEHKTKSKNNDSKSSMDSSDESSISTEHNEQTDKLKSKSSTKSDNGKLNESKVVLSDSSKDDLSQGKDDKTVRSQNNSSLGKQKEKSILSNKSFIRPDNGHKSNAESDEESYKRVNNAWSIAESDEESSIPENNLSLNRESDEDSNISQYLNFPHGIKLKSHNCNDIEFKKNPLRMKFEVPKHIKTLFVVKSINNNNKKIADAVFSQINPANSDTIVQVAIPREGEKFRFQIFAKDLRDKRSKFVYASQIFLTRTESDENDALKFCKVYPRSQNCFIYSPIEYYLTLNSLYEFRYFIKDALDVAIVDSSKKVKHMNRLSGDQHIWVLLTNLKAKGIINVLARFDEKGDYDYICYYEVI